jgi:hypothetical protein
MNNPDMKTAEGRKLLQKMALAAFLERLVSLGANAISFSADIMPREVWADCISFAIFATNSQNDAEAIKCLLDSTLGNSSQLGTYLLKEGHITRESKQAAGNSLAEALAKRAQAAQG